MLNSISLFLVSLAGYWCLVKLTSTVFTKLTQAYVDRNSLNFKINPGATEWKKELEELNIVRPLKIFVVFRMAVYAAIYFYWQPLFAAPVEPSVWFVIGILGYVVWYDLWFYILHRFVFHSKLGMKHVHYVHHHFKDPVLPVRNIFSITEIAILEIVGAIPLLLFPYSALAMFISHDVFITGINMLNHLGYETFPAGFTKHPVLKYITTSTHHSIHHAHFKSNYGLLINYDLIFGTLDKAYHSKFDKIKQRLVTEPNSETLDLKNKSS